MQEEATVESQSIPNLDHNAFQESTGFTINNKDLGMVELTFSIL